MNNTGLTTEKARELLEKFGQNELLEQPRKSALSRFLDQYKNLFLIILLFASVLSFILGEIVEGVIITGILLLNGIVGLYQEGKASQAVLLLKKQLKKTANVLRDGIEITLESRMLVPGDILIIREGEVLPADGILIDANNILLNESVLTGESIPAAKKTGDEIYSGTVILRGSGRVLAGTTGMNTKFGKIAKLAGQELSIQSPLQVELDHTAKTLGIAIIAIAAAITLIEVFYLDMKLLETLIFAIALAVGAIPEGLPTIIAMSLAYGAHRLSRVNVIVKKLYKTETLGAVSAILTDKTGTLTRGEMTAAELFTVSDGKAEVTGGEKGVPGRILKDGSPLSSFSLSRLILCGVICNESSVRINIDGKPEISGDPTEAALLFLPDKYIGAIPEADFTEKKYYPFDSHRQMMSVACLRDGKWTVFSKGAPEVILERISSVMTGEGKKGVSEEALDNINKTLQKMQEKGLRVLALAERELETSSLPDTIEKVESDLTFIGLAGILDPERSDIGEAVILARRAGIKICMVTGDSPIIAEEISRRTGIITDTSLEGARCITGPAAPDGSSDSGYAVITGKMLEKMTIEELAAQIISHKEIIFARTSPDQKAKIVDAFQDLGYIVAVTGDGVNDAPALNLADVGIAMGKTGTEVAKNTASIVLADDSFSTIIHGIEEGRKIYSNFRRTCYFVLSTNAGELFAIIAGLLMGLSPVFTAVLILIINVATETLPAFGLGIHESNEDSMSSPPRDVNVRMMNSRFIWKVLLMGLVIAGSIIGGYFWILSSVPPEILKFKILAFSFTLLVFEKILLSYSMAEDSFLWQRIPRNKILYISSLFSLLVIYAVVFSPFNRYFVKSAVLRFNDLVKIFILGTAVFLICEVMKKRWQHDRHKK